MSRILKWTVPIDDQWHGIGTGPVALVNHPPSHQASGFRDACVWTVEPAEDDPLEAYAREISAVRSIRRAREALLEAAEVLGQLRYTGGNVDFADGREFEAGRVAGWLLEQAEEQGA